MTAVPVPWDWRQSFDQATQDWLIPAIDRVKADFGVDRVSIVAHSAGGLLVRDYIQNFYRDDISKVAFLGTPQRGVVDVYLLWEGGDVTAPIFSGIFEEHVEIRIKKRSQEALLERLLENMKQGCGCSFFDSDFDFIRNGCPGTVGPMFGVRDLLPTFSYIKEAGHISTLEPIEDMCEQNSFLANLEQTVADLTVHGIPMKIFAGSTLTTMKSITVATLGNSDSCEGQWADGSPRNRNRDKNAGDGRVLLKSVCPGDDLPEFAAIPCVTQDEIPAGKKPEKKLAHGDLPDIFKEEVVAFFGGNNPPTIESLTADSASVSVNGQSTISVQASDPDGDPLTYEWSVICGSLSDDTGPEDKTWTAPSQPGLCAVSILVTDSLGATAAAMVDIEVTPPADGDFSLSCSDIVTYWPSLPTLDTDPPCDMVVEFSPASTTKSSAATVTIVPTGGFNSSVTFDVVDVLQGYPGSGSVSISGFAEVYNGSVTPSHVEFPPFLTVGFQVQVNVFAADPAHNDLFYTVRLRAFGGGHEEIIDLRLTLRGRGGGFGEE